MNYTQPDEYHFSHDSVFLARYVFEWIQKNPNFQLSSAADICAGCGVIGLDLLIHLKNSHSQLPKAIDFIEVQDVYRSYFQSNRSEALKQIDTNLSLQFLCQNYSDLVSENAQNKYDLIVCNPPYFQIQQGKQSPSEFKNRCRFYIDSDFETLLQAIWFSLTPQGAAFVLLRSLQDHKINYDLNSLSKKHQIDIQVDGNIRGTDVLKITKQNVQI